MSKIVDRGMEGAAFGGFIGGAVGTLLTGAAVASGPIGWLALATAVTVSASSCIAAGTIIGGTVGVAEGVVEIRREADDKNRK